MDFTSQMTALLSELRRERNGAAADAMRFYGKDYGLNLGVVIHTIREISADFPHDHAFAEYLYRQDVRELKIAALWLAQPERVEPTAFDFWEAGIINSEMAEQVAMALFSKVECIDALLDKYGLSDNILAVYAVLLAVSRNMRCNAEKAVLLIENIVGRYDDNRLIAQSTVAALAALYDRAPQPTKSVIEKIAQKNSTTARYISEELSWRIE